MNSKRSKIVGIILIVCLFLVVGINTFVVYLNRDKFNDTEIYGNSAGNYYNNGIFCEYNGVVYFSNPYDNYTLYSMTPDSLDAVKIGEDSVSSINVDDHYIYYVRSNAPTDASISSLGKNSNSLCRINKNGKKVKILDSSHSLFATLVGNYLYYIHYDKNSASTLYKVKIDGSEMQQLDPYPLKVSASTDGMLCYSGVENNHNIWHWNTTGDFGMLLTEAEAVNPIDTDTYVYYMDISDDYRLARINKESGEKTTLTDERVECFNIYGNYIYYQTNHPEDPALYRKSINDLDSEERIISGVFTDINITSNYVYFREFYEKNTFYQTPTFGDVDVEPLRILYK